MYIDTSCLGAGMGFGERTKGEIAKKNNVATFTGFPGSNTYNFVDKGKEAQRSEVIFPKSHSHQGADLGFKRQSGSSRSYLKYSPQGL